MTKFPLNRLQNVSQLYVNEQTSRRTEPSSASCYASARALAMDHSARCGPRRHDPIHQAWHRPHHCLYHGYIRHPKAGSQVYLDDAVEAGYHPGRPEADPNENAPVDLGGRSCWRSSSVVPKGVGRSIENPPFRKSLDL